MPIFINPRFPKTKKEYDKAGDDNTDKLKEVMSKLLIQEQAPPAAKEPVKKGGFTTGVVADYRPSAERQLFPRSEPKSAWAYTDRRKKPQTFKL